MSKTRIMSRQETALKVRRDIMRQAAAVYPMLSRRERREMAAQATREALRGKGSKFVATQKPASIWQWIKESIAPKWFIERFPVRYVEHY